MSGADVTYTIDVASSFSGEQTLSQMDALTSKLVSAGASADTFQNAVAKVSQSLSVARAASLAANSALAKGNDEYRLLEQAANQAAKAQEKAAKLGVIPPGVAASVATANAALDVHTAKLRGLEQAVTKTRSAEESLGNTLKNVNKLAAESSRAASAAESAEQKHERQLKKTAGALNGLGGPLGSVGAWAINAADDFGDMSKTMGAANAAAILAAGAFATITLVVAAVALAVVAATVAIAAWAVGLADAARSASLTTQAVEAFNPELEALHGTIVALRADTGLTESALDGIAKSLVAAKVSAADLPEALRAAALAERALGSGGANEFVAKMKASKKSVAEFSAETTSKLGGIVAKQMQSLPALAQKAKDGIGKLFGGLEIEPVLLGFERLVGLFDETTAAGSAIKFLFESVFQPLINQVDKASVVVEAFALGFLIGLTKLYIAVKPAIKAVSEFFGFGDTTTADTLAMVTKAGEYVVPVVVAIAAVFGLMAAAAGVAVAGVASILAPVFALGAAVVALGGLLITGFVSAWRAVTSYLDSITLESVGTAIMQGLANGISAATGLPVKAISDAVSAAISGAKALLGIHSPSKVFAEIGGYTAEGFAEGVDDGAPDAQDSMAALVAPPAPATGKPSSGASSSGASIIFQAGAFVLNGVNDAEHAAGMIEEAITLFFERQAAQAAGA